MSIMFSNLYLALKAANVSDEMAQKASEEVAAYDSDFNHIKLEIAAIKGRLLVLEWMMGFVLASNMAILFKVFW